MKKSELKKSLMDLPNCETEFTVGFIEDQLKEIPSKLSLVCRCVVGQMKIS